MLLKIFTCDRIVAMYLWRLNMHDVNEKEILISVDEQNKIEMLLEEIFEAIRIEALHEFSQKELNSKENLLIYRKVQANSELEGLINELIEARINNLMNKAGLDDDKIEQIRNDVLTAFLEKIFRENSSPKIFISFGEPFTMACLKLVGKQQLLANRGISMKSFDNIINELCFNTGLSSAAINMVNNMVDFENCYSRILNKMINNLALYLECKEKAAGYLADYIVALNKILESKYREEYKKTVQVVYKEIRKERLIKRSKTGFMVRRVPSCLAYNCAVGTCDNKIKIPNLGFSNSGEGVFKVFKEDADKEIISDVLKKRLDAYTFVSNLGREALTSEEIKAVEEKIHNNEVVDYEEEITILLNLRKKGNSETVANN